MNLDDLAELAEEIRAADADVTHEVRVCMAASCQSSGSQPVFEALQAAVPEGHGCRVKGVGCMGLCSAGPLVAVAPDDEQSPVLYRDVGPDDAGDIIGSVGSAARRAPAVHRRSCLFSPASKRSCSRTPA